MQKKVDSVASAGNIQKAGENPWKLTVSGGFDGAGKRIRYTKTVHCTSEQAAQKENKSATNT